MEFLKTKIDILEHALAATAGAYYSINLTKNIVPGLMYQVIDDKEYILNDHMGLPENARFSDVVTYWGNKLNDSEKKAYFEFLDIQNLLKLFNAGKTHVFHQYWTKTALFEPMLAEQHIVMYENLKNHDVLAITYVLDKTQKFKDDQHRKELETAKEKLEKAIISANAANVAKTNFLSNMSHDIRTPMNAILGFAELSEANIGNSKLVKEYIKK